MYSFIRQLKPLQRSNIEILGEIIQDSNAKNANYITIKDEFAMTGRLEWITNFKEYEIRAHLQD